MPPDVSEFCMAIRKEQRGNEFRTSSLYVALSVQSHSLATRSRALLKVQIEQDSVQGIDCIRLPTVHTIHKYRVD
jgi:hypothetical protein